MYHTHETLLHYIRVCSCAQHNLVSVIHSCDTTNNHRQHMTKLRTCQMSKLLNQRREKVPRHSTLHPAQDATSGKHGGRIPIIFFCRGYISQLGSVIIITNAFSRREIKRDIHPTTTRGLSKCKNRRMKVDQSQ